MWGLWRVHDVFEAGSLLNKNGQVTSGDSVWNRGLPDGEIVSGTPIPAVVPLPTLGMAPIPARVQLTEDGKRAITLPENEPTASCMKTDSGCFKNPGFPFFIPGMGGHRTPHPPMDFAWQEDSQGNPVLKDGKKVPLDGGMPRHLVLDGTVAREVHTKFDFTKDFYHSDGTNPPSGGLVAMQLPEEGTPIELVAMATHATRTHTTLQPSGLPGNFTLNGLPPVPGAPFAAPEVSPNGNSEANSTRRYKAAVIQTDVVLNKLGWHYPQQRLITLWDDVQPNINHDVPQQPLFFRANSGDAVEFWHTNLVPAYYEVDDFQVRTPTDILGQHIHLVKFDVLASDGAANGFNYEDGTFSADDVRDRIDAVDLKGGIYSWSPALAHCLNAPGSLQSCVASNQQVKLTAVDPCDPVHGYGCPFGKAPEGQNWVGAQTTIQRWYADPVLTNTGHDNTLRTVFTHDHFGPSTHQQAGLYAGLLIEPEGSTWYKPDSKTQMYTRADGGPTNWAANIITSDPAQSYREFALEYQDLQLAYGPASSATKGDLPQTLNTFASKTDFSGDLNNGKISNELRGLFKKNGVTLSDSAKAGTASSCPAGTCWPITDQGTPDAGGSYSFAQQSATGGGYTDTITASMPRGWMNSMYPNAPANALSPSSPPALISFAANGTYSLNYRNEPVPARVWNPTSNQPSLSDPKTDLTQAFVSMQRYVPALNCQPPLGSPISNTTSSSPCTAVPPSGFIFPRQPLSAGMGQYDPYTPLLRAYQNDRVQIRTLTGAQFNVHPVQVEGINWLAQPQSSETGYRATQGTGLSEHFELLFTVPHTGGDADYLYVSTGTSAGYTNGNWGIMRAYDVSNSQPQPDLAPLPNNPLAPSKLPPAPACPAGAAPRAYSIVATQGTIAYNSRGQRSTKDGAFGQNSITNKNALVYMLESDYEKQPTNPQPTAPLVLRANAGDCISITLSNKLNASNPPFTTSASAAKPFNTGPAAPISMSYSYNVGITPQLLTYDASQFNGTNVGNNKLQTVGPGQPPTTYTWYAGRLNADGSGIPMESGIVNLMPADPLLQHTQGLIGALVIEPPGSASSNWSGPQSLVTKADKSSFQEFVLVMQSEFPSGAPRGFGAGNYLGDPISYRQPTSQKFNVTLSGNYQQCFQDGPVCAALQAGFSTAGFSLTADARMRQVSRWVVASTVSGTTSTYNLTLRGGGLEVLSSTSPLFTVPNSKSMPAFVAGLNKGLVVRPLADQFPKHGQPALTSDCWTQGKGCVTGTPQWQINDGSGTPGTMGLWSYFFTTPSSNTAAVTLAWNISGVLADAYLQNQDPQTPIFTVAAGTPVRFRVAYPKGSSSQVLTLQGHSWQETPYRAGSSQLGYNPGSEWRGTEQISVGEKLDMLIPEAGGAAHIPGDYLYDFFFGGNSGMWGIVRVTPSPAPPK
jgi:manganese oxidase